MPAYSPPLRDIRFVFDHLVDLEGLSGLEPFSHSDPDTVFSLLEESGRFASEVLAPLNHPGDQQGARVDPDTGEVTTPDGWADAYRRYVETGWGSVQFDPSHGGGGFPWIVGFAMQELLTSANLAWSLCPQLTTGAIHMLQKWASPEQQDAYLPKLVSGEWTGTMSISEPQSGSYVGALRAKAEPADDGSWRISGTKIFITYGDQDASENIVHLVLARAPDAPPGMKGISCFIVPKFLVNEDGSLGDRNAVTCVSLEHKLGLRGCPTCVLSFDDAVGYLIGEPHAGMRYMFTMMNISRVGVGVSGVAIAERAYQQAAAYAFERRQGRALGAPAGHDSLIAEYPDVRRMLLTMRAYVEAMRALIYTNGWALDMARHHPDEDVRTANDDLVELLTPVSKAWCTDTAAEVASLAIQVHGGLGYIEDTGVAQHYRDIRAAAIYEGTNGVQGLDLIGRKLPLKGGEVVKGFLARMASLDEELAGAGEELASIRANLADGVGALEEATNWFFEKGFMDPSDAMAAGTPYLRMFGIVTGGWLMARQALAAHGLAEGAGNGAAEQKLVTARFYAEQILPQARGLLGAVTAGSQTLFAFEPQQQLVPA